MFTPDDLFTQAPGFSCISSAVPHSAVMDEEDFYIIGTLRRDPHILPADSPYYHLPLHRDRLLAAVRAFGWSSTSRELFDPDTGLSFLHSAIEAYVFREHGPSAASQPLRVSTSSIAFLHNLHLQHYTPMTS